MRLVSILAVVSTCSIFLHTPGLVTLASFAVCAIAAGFNECLTYDMKNEKESDR